MGFPRQEYWSGLPFPNPGDLPHPSIEPVFTALQADCSPSKPPGLPEQKAKSRKMAARPCDHHLRWHRGGISHQNHYEGLTPWKMVHKLRAFMVPTPRPVLTRLWGFWVHLPCVCSFAQRIFSAKGSHPRLLHWQEDSLSTVPPGQLLPTDPQYQNVICCCEIFNTGALAIV